MLSAGLRIRITFNADSDPAFHLIRIRIQSFTSVRIRIHNTVQSFLEFSKKKVGTRFKINHSRPTVLIFIFVSFWHFNFSRFRLLCDLAFLSGINCYMRWETAVIFSYYLISIFSVGQKKPGKQQPDQVPIAVKSRPPGAAEPLPPPLHPPPPTVAKPNQTKDDNAAASSQRVLLSPLRLRCRHLWSWLISFGTLLKAGCLEPILFYSFDDKNSL